MYMQGMSKNTNRCINIISTYGYTQRTCRTEDDDVRSARRMQRNVHVSSAALLKCIVFVISMVKLTLKTRPTVSSWWNLPDALVSPTDGFRAGGMATTPGSSLPLLWLFESFVRPHAKHTIHLNNPSIVIESVDQIFVFLTKRFWSPW